MLQARGAVYVVYGEPALDQARLSIQSLHQHRADMPVTVIGDQWGESLCEQPFCVYVYHSERDQGGRWAKVNLDSLSPYELTLYLDADTRVREDLSSGFELLADGWDVAIVPSECQGQRMLWHVGMEDKATTLDAWPCEPLQLQGGVFYFRKSAATATLFQIWREQWLMYEDQDQGALLRALAFSPVRVWLLGRPWNGGALVSHLFGRAKRH